MKQILGKDLPFQLQKEVLARFVHRYTGNHRPQWVTNKVTVGGITLLFNKTHNYIVCNFDPEQYPWHIKMIQKWIDNDAVRIDALKNWQDFNRLPAAIAYRGGQGYTYAFYRA